MVVRNWNANCAVSRRDRKRTEHREKTKDSWNKCILKRCKINRETNELAKSSHTYAIEINKKIMKKTLSIDRVCRVSPASRKRNNSLRQKTTKTSSIVMWLSWILHPTLKWNIFNGMFQINCHYLYIYDIQFMGGLCCFVCYVLAFPAILSLVQSATSSRRGLWQVHVIASPFIFHDCLIMYNTKDLPQLIPIRKDQCLRKRFAENGCNDSYFS